MDLAPEIAGPDNNGVPKIAAVVQAFGFGRGVLRYAERLSGHDAALRLFSSFRTSASDSLAKLAPAGLAEYRSRDLIARVVTDIDSLADGGTVLLITHRPVAPGSVDQVLRLEPGPFF